MKKATAVVVGLVVATLTILSLALAGPASAHDRDGRTCENLRASVLDLQGKLDGLLGSLDVKNLDAQKQQLAALNAALPAAQKLVADNIALDNKNNAKVDSPATVAAKTALATLQNQIKSLSDLIAGVEGRVAGLRSDLALKIGERDRVCTPTPTTTAAPPTTTVVPGPTVIVQQPRIIRVPQGSVDTGGGPA